MSDVERPDESDELSRRGLLTRAGVAVAGGVALGAAGPVADAEAADARRVAVGPRGKTVVEFASRISQTGSEGGSFTSYGFLTRVAGAVPSQLFTGSPRTPATALFTAYATGELAARVIDQAVHSIDIGSADRLPAQESRRRLRRPGIVQGGHPGRHGSPSPCWTC